MSSIKEKAKDQGKLGVLLPGFGAVSTTFVAGVELARRGQGRPIGSLTQMGTIRLGKRTEGRTPRIADFVPLTPLDDLVFGAWDPIPTTATTPPSNAGVLDRHEHIEPIKDFLSGDRADAGGLRPALREEARRAEREARHLQAGVGG
jgi:myo-inositol-1-phosphate synthase